MNSSIKSTEPDDINVGDLKNSDGANTYNNNLLDTQILNSFDDALAFDLLENPAAWPDDHDLQAELAEILEMHLAMQAHADDLAPALTRTKKTWRLAAVWILSAAAITFAILPTAYAVSRTREARRMQARGAALEMELQDHLQSELWSDFFEGSLDLLNRVKTPAKFCDPTRVREDRSEEVNQARKLYAMGNTLPLSGLDNAETIKAKNDLQNWLTEVSANDACITIERSYELLSLASEMELEDKAKKINLKLRETVP
ncbi:MAG: hypothetical protein LBH03_06775 [Holophagales bacterium]|jgi:hypothetical protein|nr:hypothetical protein [Holophagales bacterium]